MRADLQIADADLANADAHQLQHLRVDRFHHPAHLPIAPLSDGDLEKRVARRIADALDDSAKIDTASVIGIRSTVAVLDFIGVDRP